MVRINRNYPLNDSTIKKDANGNNIGIPAGATAIVTYKAISDLSLWYYIERYIDPDTGETVIIEDMDGIEGDTDGNWVFQRNILDIREEDGSPRAYCGLALEAQDGGFADLTDKCEPMSDLTEACRTLPWAEPPDCDGGRLEGALCAYDYNRDQAAQYATVYAGLPNPNAAPGNNISTLFCTYNYGGAHTHCAPPEKPLPPNDPNASEINCVRDGNGNCLFPTDCANFTSIAMWYGGLPMTDRWFCEGIPCPIAGTSENYSWTNAAPSGQPTYLKSVLPGYATEATVVFEPFKPLNADGTISYLDPDYVRLDVMEKIRAIWSSPDVRNIAKGDIVWAGRENVEHMMMVAGWGPILVTWEEIDAFWQANKSPDGGYNYAVLTTTYPEPNHDFGYNPHPEFGYVPYLVDHGLHGMTEEGPGGVPVLICPACVRPRPYYALYWQRRVQGIHNTYYLERLYPEGNAPYFIHIPDEIAVPVEEVKASPDQFDLGRDIPPTPAQ